MGVFIVMYILLFAIYILCGGSNERQDKRKFAAISCCIILWFIQAFRHETIGIDNVQAYRPFYENLSAGFSSLLDFSEVRFGFEPGFVIYSKLVRLITSNVQAYFAICSFICIAPISYVIYRYSKNVTLSFFVFASIILYHMGFSGIRQAMAFSITTFSFCYIEKKKLVPFIVTVMLASTIHVSAALFLPAYWLYHHFNLTPTKTILLVIAFILISPFFKSIAVSAVELLFGGEKYMAKISGDATPSYNLLILFFFILLTSYIGKTNEMQNRIRPIVMLAVLFQTLGLLSETASRMAYYFIPFFSLSMPSTIYGLKANNRDVISFSLICFCVFFFFYTNASGYLDVIPYKFCWE